MPGSSQEELRDPKPAVDWPGQGGGENLGAGAAREPGRLGVEVRDVARVRASSGRAAGYVLAERGHPYGVTDRLEAARQLLATGAGRGAGRRRLDG